METSLVVKLDSRNGTVRGTELNCLTPTAYLWRQTRFRASRGLKNLERFYLAHDPVDVEFGFEDDFQVKFELEGLRGKNCSDRTAKSVTTQVRASPFRKVIFDISPSDKNTFQSFKEFLLTEQMRTSGHLDMREEFYVWTITEPIKSSTYRIQFEGIEVEYVEHEVKTGLKHTKSKSLPRLNIDGQNSIQIFTFESKNLRAGDKHVFRWRYRDANWLANEIKTSPSTLL